MSAVDQNRVKTDAKKVSSRKPRLPVALHAIRWIYPRLERLAPEYAHRWFTRMFFSPMRYPVPAHEKDLIHRAERIHLNIGYKQVFAFAWGQGPAILFVHGWAGRSTQFTHFIEAATRAGYRAVAVDAPAHGHSEGSNTNIFEFKDSILALAKHIGSIHAIISHSLGGTASLFALAEGLQVEKLVTIATPTLGSEIISEYAARLQASEGSKIYLQKFIYSKFNRSFESLMASGFAKQLTQEIDMLIIHDDADKEASLENAHHLWSAYPRAKLIQTRGLGHVRILRDNKVIEECLRFIY